MDRVVKDHAPVVITRQKAETVVMVSLADWNAMEETLHMLSRTDNRARLIAAIEDPNQSGGEEHSLVSL